MAERATGSSLRSPASSESFYEVARPGVAAILRSVLAFPAIRVVDADLLQRAVEVYEVERLYFADAYLVACAERTGVGATITPRGQVRRPAHGSPRWSP